ncbi:MAG TPA: kelch repeat-containing protein [Thermoanaerobaculia bacterium]|nr:kelch repeat-containing protein [Thermoanaerobaculia bacterium]
MLSLLLATWLSLAPLHEARQEVAVATAAGRVYVFGGIAGNTVLASVEEYDPATDRWRFVAPIPEPLHHTAAAVVDDRYIYLIGGYRTLAFDATDSVYRYDALADQWTRVASLPSPRGALAAATIGGVVYAVGGLPGPSELTGFDGERWTTLAPLPTPREHLAAAAVNGKLYVISGRFGGSNRAAVEVYNPNTNTWSSRAPIPTARSGIAAAAFGDRIYVFGGEGNPAAPSGVFPQVESYDIWADSWRAEPLMPTPRHGIGAAAVGGAIYVPAGAAVAGFGITDTNEALLIASPFRRRALK